MHRERRDSEQPRQNRVPVEDAGMRADLEIRPKRFKKYPSSLRGTPRTTLPTAAPKKIASSTLAKENKKSKNDHQSGSSTWDRSSTPTPRSIKSHKTIISGK